MKTESQITSIKMFYFWAGVVFAVIVVKLEDILNLTNQMKIVLLLSLTAVALILGCSTQSGGGISQANPDALLEAKKVEWLRYADQQKAYFATLPWSGPGRQAWRDVDAESVVLDKLRAWYYQDKSPGKLASYLEEADAAMKRNWLK